MIVKPLWNGIWDSTYILVAVVGDLEPLWLLWLTTKLFYCFGGEQGRSSSLPHVLPIHRSCTADHPFVQDSIYPPQGVTKLEVK